MHVKVSPTQWESDQFSSLYLSSGHNAPKEDTSNCQLMTRSRIQLPHVHVGDSRYTIVLWRCPVEGSFVAFRMMTDFGGIESALALPATIHYTRIRQIVEQSPFASFHLVGCTM